MSNNKQLQIALEIATMAHKNVTRRDGDLYVFHVLRVANNRNFIQTKLQKTVALLHDTLEDTSITVEFLLQQGISQEVIDVLNLLTHDKENVSYEAYITNLCQSEDAMLVKLSDLNDNLDQGTLPTITDKDRERFVTYRKAQIQILETLMKLYPETFKKVVNHAI